MVRLANNDQQWKKADWRSCWYQILKTISNDSSKRCWVLIDEQSSNESLSGHDKITYECVCLGKETEDIVWGFVLSAEDRETPPTPKQRDSPPSPIQRIAAPRVKVVMQRQKTQGGTPSTLSDNIPVGSSSKHPPLSPLDLQGQNIEPLEKWYHFGFGEESDEILPSLFGQSISSFFVLNAN
jgi:hypothetical protein